MARIEFEAPLSSFQELWDTLDPTSLTVESEKKGRVELSDEAGNVLEFEGKNLDWSEEGGLTAGTVDEITLSGDDGELVEIKDFKLNATTIQAAFDEGGLQAVTELIQETADRVEGSKGDDWLTGFEGKDKLDGDKGDDVLWGGLGNDQLIGGKGADSFVFEADGSIDVVKDFDTKGGDADSIAVDAELLGTATWEKDGKNLVVTFEGEGSIELKGVKADEFNADFIVALPAPELV